MHLCFEENRKKSALLHYDLCGVVWGLVTHGPLMCLMDCLIDLSVMQCSDFHLIVLHISEDFYGGRWCWRKNLQFYSPTTIPLHQQCENQTRYKPKCSRTEQSRFEFCAWPVSNHTRCVPCLSPTLQRGLCECEYTLNSETHALLSRFYFAPGPKSSPGKQSRFCRVYLYIWI